MLSMHDHVLHDSGQLLSFDEALQAEMWASGWFGNAWWESGPLDRAAAHAFCAEIVVRAHAAPSPRALAALAALHRVAHDNDRALLAEAIETLAATQPSPAWAAEPLPEPVRAFEATDPWQNEQILYLEYRGVRPHLLTAAVGGTGIRTLTVCEPVALDTVPPAPFTRRERAVPDVLTLLAEALQRTDMTLPRPANDDFTEHRALAWSRCRAHLPAAREPSELL